MRKGRTGPSEKSNLRRRAEGRLRANESATGPSDSVADSQKILQELQIHKIELEIQNEELLRIRAELERSRKRHFDLYDLAPVGYLTLGSDGLIIEANLKASTLLGVSRVDLVKQPLTRFILPEDQDTYYLQYKKLLDTLTPQDCELRMLRKEGNQFWARIQADVAEDADDATMWLVVISDITKRKHIEEALRESERKYRELSIIDDLSQLYNSRYFYVQLKSETDRSNRYGQPLTLLLLDLDNFKAFNDAYGHIEGDKVILRLGQVVKRCLRQTDSAYRYGGEEFTIILPMTTGEEGAVTAERIRSEFKKETFSPDPGQDVHVTVSIGLSQYNPQEDIKAFVHRVDQLMYQGKKNGKDRVCSKS